MLYKILVSTVAGLAAVIGALPVLFFLEEYLEVCMMPSWDLLQGL
ncbi:MAG: hypothetical protein XD50_1587 [Clostridia bacterium 41_269]|nr:MAG: hypothetical protein XD50_1587 [Clostridia bacterium 41_269]